LADVVLAAMHAIEFAIPLLFRILSSTATSSVYISALAWLPFVATRAKREGKCVNDVNDYLGEQVS
jgi:hypothetical protein